jgi:hypothetical protein
MDLIAYFDEAGTHASTRLTVMAGWVADVDRWRRFESEWARLLARNGISYVHGTDLMSGKGPFKGWSRDRRATLFRRNRRNVHERNAIRGRRPSGQCRI